VQLHCVSCHFLTLHVSAYMAIFRCVAYFYFYIFEGICFASFFFLPFFHVVTLCTFPFVFFCAALLRQFCCCFLQADKHTCKKQELDLFQSSHEDQRKHLLCWDSEPGPFLLTEGGNRSRIQNVAFSIYMDKAHKPNDSECCKPSPETFRFY
jgi:hypothetical protein